MSGSIDRLSKAFEPLAETLLPAEELAQRMALRKAVRVDGTLDPRAHAALHDPVILTTFIAGTLTVATSQGAQHRCPRPGRITRIDARARTAPTGQSLNVRITRNGVMLATLAIAAGQTLATWSDGADVEAGDWLAVDITQIGSGTAGANLSVQMEEMVRA
jgi:hypothetical protein